MQSGQKCQNRTSIKCTFSKSIDGAVFRGQENLGNVAVVKLIVVVIHFFQGEFEVTALLICFRMRYIYLGMKV